MNPTTLVPRGVSALLDQRLEASTRRATLNVGLSRLEEKGVSTKVVFSLEDSLESLESLESGRILLCFAHFGGSRERLESPNFLGSLENGHF